MESFREKEKVSLESGLANPRQSLGRGRQKSVPRTAVVFKSGNRILMLLVSEDGPPHPPTQSLSPWDVRTRPVPQSETLCTAQRSLRPRRDLHGFFCTVLKKRLRQGISAKKVTVGAKLFKIWRFKLGRFDVREIS